MARDTVGPLFKRRVGRLLRAEDNREVIRPRVGLRLEDLVEDMEAGCRSRRLMTPAGASVLDG